MKAIALISAAALSLSACSTAKIVSDINSITGALTSPQAQQAVANAKALGMTMTCALAQIDQTLVTVNDAIAGAVKASPALAAQISAKTATVAQIYNGVVTVAYAANNSICVALGGTAAGPLPVSP